MCPASLNIAATDIPALRRDYFRDDRLDPHLMTLIASLRADGYKAGLLSNDALTLEEKLRGELNIYNAFDAVVISAGIGVMKPDPGAYEAIARALGVAMSECVFIDDNAANVEGARQCGMQAIHYRVGMELGAALRRLLEKSNLDNTDWLSLDVPAMPTWLEEFASTDESISHRAYQAIHDAIINENVVLKPAPYVVPLLLKILYNDVDHSNDVLTLLTHLAWAAPSRHVNPEYENYANAAYQEILRGKDLYALLSTEGNETVQKQAQELLLYLK